MILCLDFYLDFLYYTIQQNPFYIFLFFYYYFFSGQLATHYLIMLDTY